MKRFILTLATVFVTVLAFGQVKSVPAARIAAIKAAKSAITIPQSVEREKRATAMTSTQVSRRAPSIITDAPAGTMKTYQRSGYYFTLNDESNTEYSIAEQSGIMAIVFAEDGSTVYIQNPICGYENGAWVQGTLSQDGTTITLPLGQYVLYNSTYGYGMFLAMINVTNTGGIITGTYDDTATEVTYTIDGDNIVLNGTSESRALGLVWSDDFTMSYQATANYNSTYTYYEIEEPDKIVPPEGLETTPLTWVGRAYLDGYQEVMYDVEIGFSDEDVYLKGFDNTLPDGWIAGFYDEGAGEIIFPAGQYIGLDSNNNFHYLMGSEDIDDVTDLVYSYRVNSEGKHILVQKTGYYGISYSDASFTEDGFEYLGYASGMHNLTPVVAPANLETETYTFSYKSGTAGDENSKSIQFGVLDGKAYIKGMDSAAGTGGWMVGTVNGNTITFETPQVFDADREVVLLVRDAESEEFLDHIDFSYNPTTQVIQQQEGTQIAVNSMLIERLYFYELIAEGVTSGFVEPDKVVPPAGLETVDAFLASSTYDSGTRTTDVLTKVKIGFVDEDVYIQGFDTKLPEDWIRGTLDPTAGTVTFDVQYIGMDSEKILHYLAGSSGTDVTNLTFSYRTVDDGKFVMTLTNPDFYTINKSATSSGFVYYGYNASIHNLAPITEKPEGLDVNIYTYNYTKVSSTGNTAASKNVFFGVLDGKAYIKGLANASPNVWVVGTVEGNKITFNTPQSLDADGEIMLLGYDRTNTTFLESIEFEYDPTTQLITQVGDYELVVNSVLLNLLYTYEVMKAGSTAAFADELVTPPAGLATTTKYFEGRKSGSPVTFSRQNITYGVDGTDVYIKGLFAELPDAWVKGTLADDESTITIPTNQYLGLLNDKTTYLSGYSSSGVGDIVLTKSQHGIYRTKTYLVPATAKGGTSYQTGFYYYTAIAIAPALPASITPPATLETSEFSLTSSAEATARTVQVGFDGDDVYIQGIYSGADYVNAWIKGTKSGDKYVFVTPQRLGNYYMYFIGYEGTNLVDEVEFTYNAETNTFTQEGTYLINGNIASAYYTQMVTGATLVGPEPQPTGINDVMTDGISGGGKDAWYNVNGARIAQPTQKGIYIKNGKKYAVK